MKIRDRVVQSRRRQPGQLLLEASEGSPSLEGLFRRFHCIVRARPLNKTVCAPMVACRIHVPSAPVPRRNQPQRAPAPIRLIGNNRSQVRRHPLHVLHQGFRVFEDVVIDPLQDVAKRRASILEK